MWLFQYILHPWPSAPCKLHIPGFKFWEIPGATLNVIGILNPNAQAQHAQEIQASETLFVSQFFLQVLNPCIDGLPLQTKTRVNNLMKTSLKTQILPTYHRIYRQDTPALSSAIQSMLVSNNPNSTYQPITLCLESNSRWHPYQLSCMIQSKFVLANQSLQGVIPLSKARWLQ